MVIKFSNYLSNIIPQLDFGLGLLLSFLVIIGFVLSFIGGSLGYFKYVAAFGSAILVIFLIGNSSSPLAALFLALGIFWLAMFFVNRKYK